MSADPPAAQGRYRELTPEQYAKGFIAGRYRVPFGPIIRVTDHGTYIVRDPEAVLPRVSSAVQDQGTQK